MFTTCIQVESHFPLIMDYTTFKGRCEHFHFNLAFAIGHVGIGGLTYITTTDISLMSAGMCAFKVEHNAPLSFV